MKFLHMYGKNIIVRTSLNNCSATQIRAYCSTRSFLDVVQRSISVRSYRFNCGVPLVLFIFLLTLQICDEIEYSVRALSRSHCVSVWCSGHCCTFRPRTCSRFNPIWRFLQADSVHVFFSWLVVKTFLVLSETEYRPGQQTERLLLYVGLHSKGKTSNRTTVLWHEMQVDENGLSVLAISYFSLLSWFSVLDLQQWI